MAIIAWFLPPLCTDLQEKGFFLVSPCTAIGVDSSDRTQYSQCKRLSLNLMQLRRKMASETKAKYGTINTVDSLRKNFDLWMEQTASYRKADADEIGIELSHIGPNDISDEDPDNEQMSGQSDLRTEIELRHELLRQEIQMRQDALRQEQAIRDKALDERFAGFIAAQAERDKRMEDIADRATKAAESAATVKSNYWAAVGVQLLAVAAILVGGYFALHQSNQSVAQTVQSSYQMGRDDGRKEDSKPPVIPVSK